MGIDYPWTKTILSSEVEELDHYSDEQSEDEIKECIDCENSFQISPGEINYFIQHGLVAPKRCKPCRAERKANPPVLKTSTFAQQPIQHEKVAIVCDHCGREADVPFKPFAGRSVYCRVCWVGIKNIGAPINYNVPQKHGIDRHGQPNSY